MAKDYPRSDRVAQLLSRNIALLISKEINDERVKALNVIEVEVTRDLRHAEVFLVASGMPDQEMIDQSMRALQRAGKFIRHHLMQNLDMRRCPELHFKYDYSVQRGAEMSALIDSIDIPESAYDVESTAVESDLVKKTD